MRRTAYPLQRRQAYGQHQTAPDSGREEQTDPAVPDRKNGEQPLQQFQQTRTGKTDQAGDQNAFHRRKGNRNASPKRAYSQKGGEQLACQQAPQAALDAEKRYEKPGEGKPDCQTGQIMPKNMGGFSKPVEDTADGGGEIKKRADPGQGRQVAAHPGITVKQQPQGGAETEKAGGGENPHKYTERQRGADRFLYFSAIAQSVGLGNRREQHERKGTGDGTGQHDQGHGHSGENAVGGQGGGGTVIEKFQAGGDQGRFPALEEI